jgi:hypothetical protein
MTCMAKDIIFIFLMAFLVVRYAHILSYTPTERTPSQPSTTIAPTILYATMSWAWRWQWRREIMDMEEGKGSHLAAAGNSGIDDGGMYGTCSRRFLASRNATLANAVTKTKYRAYRKERFCCCCYVDVVVTWMLLLRGCCCYVDVVVTWMLLLHGIGRLRAINQSCY